MHPLPLHRSLPLLLLLLLPLVCRQNALSSSSLQDATSLSDEPLLRELFSGEPGQLSKLSSCLDTVFKLRRAHEVLYSLKSIYSDFLSGRTDKLTDTEQRILLFCRDALPTGGGSAGAYLLHPVNAHRFVTFTARSVNPRLRDLVSEHAGVKILLSHLVTNAGCWLNEASVAESMQNLLTIKMFYNISVDDFASGNISGRRAESGFSAQELMEFLLHLNRQFDPVQVVEMAEYLRRERREEMRSLGEQPVRSVYRILGKAYYQMKQFDKAVETLREYPLNAAAPGSRGVDADIRYIEGNRRGEPKDFQAEAARSLSSLERDLGLTLSAREGFQRYRRLCIGDEAGAGAANLSSNPLLICEHWRPYNGWYAIRKEILNVAPLVVRYFGVFTSQDNFTDSLMLEAEKRIYETPPEDFGPIEGHNRLTKVRMHSFREPTSPFNSNVTRTIIRRIEFVTRLDATVHFASSEKYIDVTNYGHGIRNLPHVTSNLPDRFYDGMATAIFFPVEDVIGGEVVFPDKDLKIPIQRSDLYVWYNYLPTYHVDKSALNYRCPIAFGDKWTARVTLGLSRCSVDQEVLMEPWLPGETLARRRSVARSWTSLPRTPPKAQPKVNETAASSDNGTHVNVTAAAASVNSSLVANSTELNPEAERKADSKEEEVVESTDADEKDEADEEAD